MTQPQQKQNRNGLPASLADDDYARLAPHLTHVATPRGTVFAEAGVPFEHVFFPESGIGSVIASIAGAPAVEVGLFGRDGMSSIATLLDVDALPQRIVVQVAGDALSIPIIAFREALDASRSLHITLLRYVHVCIAQSAFTALSNATMVIEERLARWLLMCHDRIDGDEIALTHDALSAMLGVRRPSVTTALHVLEGNLLIRARRGIMRIRDRAGLIAFAGGSYGPAENTYDDVIGRSGVVLRVAA